MVKKDSPLPVGLVYVPYIIETTTESSKEYDEFMNNYKLEHECCPICGSDTCDSTLAGYVLNMDNKESYKDKNKCRCVVCDDIHITHERVRRKIE